MNALNILAGLGIGIVGLLIFGWLISHVGETPILLVALLVLGLVGIVMLTVWTFTAVRGIGRWARRQ